MSDLQQQEDQHDREADEYLHAKLRFLYEENNALKRQVREYAKELESIRKKLEGK